MKVTRTLLVLIISLKFIIAMADDKTENLPTTISLDFTSDSFNTKTSSIYSDIALHDRDHDRLFLGANKSTTADDIEGYNPSGITIGVGTDPLADWIYGAYLNTWGIPNQITANSISGTFKYVSDNWDFQLAPRVRRIVGYLAAPARDFAIINLSATGSYNLYFLKNWKWMVSLEIDSYDKRINQLQKNLDKLTAFAPNVGKMMQTFNYYLFAMEISYQFKKWSPSFEIQAGKSAISDSRFSTTIVRANYNFNKTFSAEISAGATTDLDGTSGTDQFVGISGFFSL